MDIFRKLKSSEGFTLLEIMAAMAVLSGVIITVISSLNYHLSFIERDRNETIAVILAKEKLEEIRIMGLSKEREGDFASRFEGFRWRYAEEAQQQAEHIKKIYITVSWGNNEKVEMGTYVYESQGSKPK